MLFLVEAGPRIVLADAAERRHLCGGGQFHGRGGCWWSPRGVQEHCGGMSHTFAVRPEQYPPSLLGLRSSRHCCFLFVGLLRNAHCADQYSEAQPASLVNATDSMASKYIEGTQISMREPGRVTNKGPTDGVW